MKHGTLYGIGVGPGDPELLTLKATRALSRARVIFAAASARNDFSHALTIARPYLANGADIVHLHFPMTRNGMELEEAWARNARVVAATLETGEDAAFLTLGDPLIYSTFGYLMRTLNRDFPAVEIEVIPGVTSFQAAAAHTRTVLCESGESLLLVSGINSERELEEHLRAADNAVILKAYRNYEAIRRAVRARGKEKRSVFVSRVGQAEELVTSLENAPENPHYLSLVLVK